jgi:anti-sigma B factor antagonist
MVVHTRFVDDVAVLSNFAGLLNDPRHFDASRDVDEMLDEGYRKFVFELAGMHALGHSALGLLVTLTRQIRQAGGEAVLARLSKDTRQTLADMQLEEHWDVFPNVDEATRAFSNKGD